MTLEPEHHGDLGEPVAAQRELFRDRHIPEHAQSKDTVQEEQMAETYFMGMLNYGGKACALKVKMKGRKTSEHTHCPAFPKEKNLG